MVEDTSSAKLQASEAGLKDFIERGYGLSMHWGLYSLLFGDEWVYYNQRVPFDEYRGLMARFDPTRFNADEWGDLMLESGQKFLLITTKHHDGFCLWDTKLTDFRSTNTAFGRDIIAELAEAMDRRGLALHFYYSLVDWTHPDYRNNWSEYIGYYQAQLRELMSNYGRIGGVIFDGYWPEIRQQFEGDGVNYFGPTGKAEWLSFDLAGTYDLIHEVQPDAVVTNNTHVLPLKGEDYQVWELDLPGENSAGFNTTLVGDKPGACWWNLNEGWSYQPWRHRVKSPEDLLRPYSTMKERGGVFILNVGPRSFGDIHPEEQAALRNFGRLIAQ